MTLSHILWIYCDDGKSAPVSLLYNRILSLCWTFCTITKRKSSVWFPCQKVLFAPRKTFFVVLSKIRIENFAVVHCSHSPSLVSRIVGVVCLSKTIFFLCIICDSELRPGGFYPHLSADITKDLCKMSFLASHKTG